MRRPEVGRRRSEVEGRQGGRSDALRQRRRHCKAYISTTATPEVPFTPRTIAVYCALLAGNVRTIADSRSFVGGIVLSITACRSASGWFFQSSLAASNPPF